MITFLVPWYRAAMGSEYDRLLTLAQEVTNPLTPFHVGCQFQFGSLLRGDSLAPQSLPPTARCVISIQYMEAAHGAAHGEHGEVDFLRLWFHRIGVFRASCLRRSSMNRMEFNPTRHQDPNSSSSMVNTPHVVAIPGGVRVQGICPGLIPLPAPLTQP
ncbi:unnamed protein product [Arctogadus glacialis]